MASKTIVGEKIGMTQVWDDENRVVPVTVVRVTPMRVVQVKTPTNDGYSVIQVAIGHQNPRRVNQPTQGHYAKAGVEPGRRLVELRIDDVSEIEAGQELNVGILEAGERVDVTAISKGKGFTGVMKRHGFHGVSASHGQKRNHRKPGSIGAGSTPSRVFKGMKMAGHMGHVRKTVQNLTVHAVDTDQGLLLIKGAVPGPVGSLVFVRSAAKGAAQ